MVALEDYTWRAAPLVCSILMDDPGSGGVKKVLPEHEGIGGSGLEGSVEATLGLTRCQLNDLHV